MPLGETVECLARNKLQGDLSFELDAMDAVLGHGFHPLKARQRRSIPNLQTVHRQGAFQFAVTVFNLLTVTNNAGQLAPITNAELPAPFTSPMSRSEAVHHYAGQNGPAGEIRLPSFQERPVNFVDVYPAGLRDTAAGDS